MPRGLKGWLALFCLLLATAAMAEDRMLKVALYDFGFLYNAATKKGVDLDVVNELQRRSGVHFDVTVQARARIWQDIETGDLDLTTSGISTPEREAFAWFAPYLIMKNYAVLGPAASAGPGTVEDFLAHPEWKFGVVASFRHGTDQDRWIEQMKSAGRVEASTTAEELFKKLQAGRIQGLFAQPVVYPRYFAALDLGKGFVVRDWTPQEKGVVHGLVLSKKRFTADEAAVWKSLVRQMIADGTVGRIFRRHFTEAESARLEDF